MSDIGKSSTISNYIKGLLESKKGEAEQEFIFTDSAPTKSEKDSQTVNYTIDVDHKGATVFLRGWLPASVTENYPILIVHDFAENSVNYKKACQLICNSGYPVYTYDLRGHGRNGSVKSEDMGFDTYLKDILQITNWIRFKSDRKKPLILSQGLSSLLVSIFAERHPEYVRAIGLVSPILLTKKQPSLMWRATINSMREVFPSRSIPRKFLPEFLTVFEKDIDNSKSFYFSVQLVYEFLEELEESSENFSNLSIQTGLFFGSKKAQIAYDEICRRINDHEYKELFNVYSMDDSISHPLSSDFISIESLLSNLLPWLEKQKSGENDAVF